MDLGRDCLRDSERGQHLEKLMPGRLVGKYRGSLHTKQSHEP